MGNLTDQSGTKVSGAFNIIKSLTMLTQKFKPDRLIVCWDKGKCDKRIEIYPEYKAQRDKNRDPKDSEMIAENKKIAMRILKHMPVIQIQRKGIEADDIIGYLTSRLKGTKVVVSTDQDFLMLVKKGTNLYSPYKKKLINIKNIDEHLGFPHDKFLLYKAICGDASDNVKGVSGMGPKRTTQLILDDGEIKKEWIDIIDRNCSLMNIGAILTEPDVTKIEEKYAKDKGKSCNLSAAKRIMQRHSFFSLTKNFDNIKRAFSGLKKA